MEGTDQVQISNTAQTNLGISAGINFQFESAENEQSVSLPLISSFSLGLGYANFYVGDSKYQDGVLLIIGFKVRGLSFNFGKKTTQTSGS